MAKTNNSTKRPIRPAFNDKKYKKLAVNEITLKNMTMDMLTKTRVFTELDVRLKALIVAAALIPVGLLTYIGFMANSISGTAGNFAGIDISSARSSFFYEAGDGINVSLPMSGSAQLVNDPALAHSGRYSLKYHAADKYHFSQSYFNTIGVNIKDDDVLEFYIRSASSVFNSAGAANAIGVRLTYANDASSTSELIDITPQFPGGVVTTEYQKIEIPREEIGGSFGGKMRSLYISVNPALVGSGQDFLVDDIIVRRRVAVLEASSTKAVVLNNAVYRISTSSVSLAWPNVAAATGYKIYLAAQAAYLTDPAKRELVGTISNGQTTYMIGNLVPNRSYYIRIEAEGAPKAYQTSAFHTCPLYDRACILKSQ